MNGKALYQSKTVWFNVITTLLGVLSLTEFQNVVPKSWSPYILLVNAVGNLVLRTFFTTQPITFNS